MGEYQGDEDFSDQADPSVLLPVRSQPDWSGHRDSKMSDKNIPCPICFKTFKTRGSLATHKYNFHKDNNRESFPGGVKATADPLKMLDYHMVEPSVGEVRDVECPICHKFFSTRGSLATHKYNYHRTASHSRQVTVRPGDQGDEVASASEELAQFYTPGISIN